MIADDRDSHPMSAFMELDIRGRMDAGKLQRAYASAIDRHPLLRSRIMYNLFRVPQWVSVPPHPPDFAEWHELLTCPHGERLDLTVGPGMRSWVRFDRDRTRITIQVHHACSDAIGKLTFLADWLRTATNEEPIGLDGSRMELPGNPARPVSESRKVRRNGRAPGVLSDLYRFLACRTVPLRGTPFQDTSEVAPLPGLYSVAVDNTVLECICQSARQQSVTVNDWLLAALFIALESWTDVASSNSTKEVFSVVIPFSLRSAQNLISPASNQISYAVLARRRQAQVRFEALCREISEFTGQVRKSRSSTFARLLRAINTVPILVPVVTRNWARPFATVVFSNLGDVNRLFGSVVNQENGLWKFGRFVVEGIRCAPPTRPQTHLAMVAMKYGQQLHFMTRCEGRDLAPSSVCEFMDHYRRTVITMAGRSEMRRSDHTGPDTSDRAA